MLRLGIIFGLLFQSLVAICCGNYMPPRADGCCGTTVRSCCDGAGDAGVSGCCTPVETDACCGTGETIPTPSDCECCVVGQEMPQAPAEPGRRYSGDTQGAAVAPGSIEAVLGQGVREPWSLALRCEPPWPSGRALLADQCRLNL